MRTVLIFALLGAAACLAVADKPLFPVADLEVNTGRELNFLKISKTVTTGAPTPARTAAPGPGAKAATSSRAESGSKAAAAPAPAGKSATPAPAAKAAPENGNKAAAPAPAAKASGSSASAPAPKRALLQTVAKKQTTPSAPRKTNAKVVTNAKAPQTGSNKNAGRHLLQGTPAAVTSSRTTGTPRPQAQAASTKNNKAPVAVSSNAKKAVPKRALLGADFLITKSFNIGTPTQTRTAAPAGKAASPARTESGNKAAAPSGKASGTASTPAAKPAAAPAAKAADAPKPKRALQGADQFVLSKSVSVGPQTQTRNRPAARTQPTPQSARTTGRHLLQGPAAGTSAKPAGNPRPQASTQNNRKAPGAAASPSGVKKAAPKRALLADAGRELLGADFLIKTVTVSTPTQARTAAPAPGAKAAASSRTESGNKAAAPAPAGKAAAPAPAAKAAPESGNKAAAPAATPAPKAAGSAAASAPKRALLQGGVAKTTATGPAQPKKTVKVQQQPRANSASTKNAGRHLLSGPQTPKQQNTARKQQPAANVRSNTAGQKPRATSTAGH